MIKMNKQSNFIKIIYFIKFFADAIFTGYLTMFFEQSFSRNTWEYGILLGVIPFCALTGNFIWGLLSKNVSKNLFLIKIILSLESIFMIVLMSNNKDFISLLISTILFSLFNSPCFTMQDGLASIFSKKENTNYPSIRYMGSTGYLCALLVGSLLLRLFSNNFVYIFIFAVILNIICLVLWFFIKPFKDVEKEEVKKIKFTEVLKNKTFVLYFISYLLIIGSNSVADSYLFSRFKEVNIEESIYSLIVASEVLIEIIVMVLINKFIKEDKYVLILKIAVSVIFLRTVLFGFDLPLIALMFAASLRGIGWGGFIAVHLMIVRKIVSNNLVTKAISILTILYSLFNGVVTIVAPSIYNNISLPGFYLLLSITMLIGIIILMFIKFDFKLEGVANVN